jgi:hypothetical protein
MKFKLNGKMCNFCYAYGIELVGEGFLAVVEKPRTVMTRIKCKCRCDGSSLARFEGNAQCGRCEHYVIGMEKARKAK